MSKKLVFLWNSTIEPWSTDVQKILGGLARVSKKGLTVKRLDTKDMPEEQQQRWRKEALTASVWRHQQIRQYFGASQLDLGRQVPALLVYEEGDRVPTAVYPHTKKAGREKRDHSIKAFLEELIDSLGG